MTVSPEQSSAVALETIAEKLSLYVDIKVKQQDHQTALMAEISSRLSELRSSIDSLATEVMAICPSDAQTDITDITDGLFNMRGRIAGSIDALAETIKQKS